MCTRSKFVTAFIEAFEFLVVDNTSKKIQTVRTFHANLQLQLLQDIRYGKGQRETNKSSKSPYWHFVNSQNSYQYPTRLSELNDEVTPLSKLSCPSSEKGQCWQKVEDCLLADQGLKVPVWLLQFCCTKLPRNRFAGRAQIFSPQNFIFFLPIQRCTRRISQT